MPSPFPGMNPYLEHPSLWPDVHNTVIDQMKIDLLSQLRPHYYVRTQVRMVRQWIAWEELRNYTSVPVIVESRPLAENGTAIHAPLVLPFPRRFPIDENQSYLEIYAVGGKKPVTVIELLSPSNKGTRKNRRAYAKHREKVLRRGRQNWVEIDLTRGGDRPDKPRLPACDYYTLVSDQPSWPDLGIWPISLQSRLPVLPIPVATSDPPVLLDLQNVLKQAYASAGYGNYCYETEPRPPLSPNDQEWADAILAANPSA